MLYINYIWKGKKKQLSSNPRNEKHSNKDEEYILQPHEQCHETQEKFSKDKDKSIEITQSERQRKKKRNEGGKRTEQPGIVR